MDVPGSHREVQVFDANDYRRATSSVAVWRPLGLTDSDVPPAGENTAPLTGGPFSGTGQVPN